MNFYDVLAAEKWDGGIPTINFFDLLFAQSMGGEQWQVYEGTLPATFNANGDNMRQYRIYGNTGGVGDRTVNLFDKNDPDVLIGYEIYNGEIRPHSHWFITGYIPVEQGQYYSKKLFGQNILGYNQSKEKVSDNASLSPIENGISFIRLNALKENINFAMLTEGSTAPASYVPFGYEVDMVSKTRNLFDISTATFGKYIDDNGVERSSTASDALFKLNHSDFININPETDYVFVYKGSRLTADQRVAFCWYTDSKKFLYRDSYLTEPPLTEYQFNKTSPSNAKYLIINFYGYNNNARYMLNVGNTALPYEPYSNTITPIYIGDTPLDKGEYVDYQAGKIYRMIDSTLTPTDPPVPLPALPTCEGTTVIDYAGESVAPEKVLLEYAKGGN